MVAIKFGVLDGRKIESSVRNHVKLRILVVANSALAYAMKTSPIRTGFMHSTINMKPVSDYRFNLTARAYYSVFVHDGTKFMRARPWLANAVAKAIKTLSRRKDIKGNSVIKQTNTYPNG